MIGNITKTFVEDLPYTTEKGKQAFYYDIKLKGFGLRVGNKVKTYFAETKISGKTVRVTIGKHDPFTTDQARKLAKQKLAEMSQNINPNAVEKAQQLKLITLQEVYTDYLSVRNNLKPNTLRDYKACMDIYFKDWINKPIINITRDLIEKKHTSLSTVSKARANLAMRFLRALFNYSLEYRDDKDQPIIADNPVKRLNAKKLWNKIETRNNYIKAHQLKAWWVAVCSLTADPDDSTTNSREVIRDYLLILLFTGLRREEALTLTWNNIDLVGRTLTAKDTKNGSDHILPLSDFLFDLLKRRKDISESSWVFPGTGKHGRLVDPRKQIYKVVKISNIYFTPHDMRRTFASIVNTLGSTISYYTVKRLLNHTCHDVTAGYVQHDIEKLREAMQAVTDYILKHATATNV